MRYVQNLNFDHKKESIIITANNCKFDFTHGFMEPIIKELSKRYNIIVFGCNEKQIITCRYISGYIVYDSKFKNDVRSKMFISKDFSIPNMTSYEYNHNILRQEIRKVLPDLNVKHIISGNDRNMLFFASYKEMYLSHQQEEFFDYIGSDETVIRKVNNDIQYMLDNYTSFINPTSFLKINLAINIDSFIEFGLKYNPISMYSFVLDPTTNYHLYKLVNADEIKTFYFANDFRGTRQLSKFPIAEFQYSIYDWNKQTNKDNPIENRKSFIWAGSLFARYNTTNRQKIYYDLLHNIKYNDASIYAPLSRSMPNNESKEKIHQRNINNIIKESAKLYNDLVIHKNYKGFIKHDLLLTEIANYRYGYISACISINESLNNRPIFYCQNNTMPIFQSTYDNCGLQVPKELQVIADTTEELEEKINYYDTHLKERQDIIDGLKEHFKIAEIRKNPEKYVQSIIEKYW